MKTVIAVIVVLVVLGGGYALIKNNDNNSKSNSSSTMNMSSSSNSSNESSKTVATNLVKISDFAFSPADITVKKGTTVTWTNEDNVVHTVTETDGRTGPQSDDLQKGDTYTFTFNDMGTFKYHCSHHSSMTGTVTVTE